MIAVTPVYSVETSISSTDGKMKIISNENKRTNRQRRSLSSHLTQNNQLSNKECPLCSWAHLLAKCLRFQKKNVRDRRSILRRYRLCFNCFRPHMYAMCESPKRCSLCQDKHHTLLHFKDNEKSTLNSTKSVDLSTESNSKTTGNDASINILTASIQRTRCTILLATAQIILHGSEGRKYRARALIDQGSEASFITDSVVQALRLHKQETDITLTGIGASKASSVKYKVQVSFGSIYKQDFEVGMEALVLSRLTSYLPSPNTLKLDRSWFHNFSLADPYFFKSASVEVILGADVLGQILLSGVQHFPDTHLIAQNTHLGWIVSGPVEINLPRRAENDKRSMPLTSLHCTATEDLKNSLEKFWVIEEVANDYCGLSPDEEKCEFQFSRHHRRDSVGRYEVELPFRTSLPCVAFETRKLAVKSLQILHRRFKKDAKLAIAYKAFMREYETLGHMSQIPESELTISKAWYLPHHAVIQESVDKWKLRVVFDASRCIQDGQSLNRYLYPGPALQTDLSHVLTQWRLYRWVFTADIVKMFRQIKVHPNCQDYQRIVWAENENEKPRDFRLTTVTYGTVCAPFLAIRTLRQLAMDEKLRFPLGADCLLNNIYVDDLFVGAHTLTDAKLKQDELCQLLSTAGITLSKWAANDSLLFPKSVNIQMADYKPLSTEEVVKTLGLRWQPHEDAFFFSNPPNLLSSVVTMRSVMSEVARLFDPLGWISPITITAKILLQDIWILKCSLDEVMPEEIIQRWVNYCNSLSELNTITIPRWLAVTSTSKTELHGFADASKRAYGAVVYVRVSDESGPAKISLLASKTKVSPIKTVSILNLELNGAALLVKLVYSQVVLSWLRKHPCHWKTYVANRVSFIQTELPAAEWRYVKTSENPADLVSRGVTPVELRTSKLWWRGPDWLTDSRDHWSDQPIRIHNSQLRVENREPELLKRFSSITRLIRVMAYCLRFIKNLRLRQTNRRCCTSFLTSTEISEAQIVIIRKVQEAYFTTELKILSDNSNPNSLKKNNSLQRLNPFICPADGLLRVGGRLCHSQLSRDAKHPPILPKDSILSTLFIRQAHLSCMHGGFTLTKARLLQNVWILSCNRLIKREIRFCIVCQKTKPKLAHQLMGDLPSDRVMATSRSFEISGVDYAGPSAYELSREEVINCIKVTLHYLFVL
ncbi:uncharacterized protein [Prorops nasuta]|uniref:uncharacterized protein n=1 Tax=Prorops nasuta TaxID=863751 RepID=UPI0034D00302